MATNDAINLSQLKQSVFNMKNYVDSNRPAYVKSETECVSIDTSTMKDSFSDNIYIYEQDAISYLEEGIEYHIKVNDNRYRCLCINNIPGQDIIYESINIETDDFSLNINNKVGYSNGKYTEDTTKSSVSITLSDELLKNPPIITVIKMDIVYMPTYLMPKNLDILNSISMNRIGKIGTGSIALGYSNIANNDFSTALGVNTEASGIATLSNGGYCVANGNYSHAEGYKTETTGLYSHSEGIVTVASGQGSHAEGFYTLASGIRSHAEGCYTTAASSYQHVEGKFNIEDTANKYAHIVGNGSSKNAKSNAYTLDWSGNGIYTGKVTVGLEPSEDNDLTTKKYVDDKVAGIVDSAPETLDTLKELSTALGDDPNFATTVATNIGNKVDKVDGKGLSTNDLTDELKTNYDAAYTYSQATHSYNDLTDKPEIPSIDGLATTEYVDNKQIFEQITSDDANLCVINDLLKVNNFYKLEGNFKFFTTDSQTTTLNGLFLLENVNSNTKALRKLNNNGLITNTSYIISVTNKSYEIKKTQEINFIQSVNNFLLLENLTSGMYSTTALGVKIKENDTISTSLGVAGIKYISITRASSNGNIIWNLNVFGSILMDISFTLSSEGNSTLNYYNKYVTNNDILTKTNITEYTPTADYHPATKKYVDDVKESIVVPTKTSELTNDSNYLTSIPDEYVTETELSSKGYLTEHQSLDGYATTEYVDSKLNTNYVSKEELTESIKPATTSEVKTTINDILGGDYVE